MDEKLKELSLLLLYLAGWEEEVKDNPDEKIFKSWTGYLFDVLNALEDEKLIKQFYQKRALLVLPEGLKKAKDLQAKYF